MESGRIDVIATIYFNPSQNLDDSKTILISKLNFKNDTIIEIVPDIDYPDRISNIYLIIDSTFSNLGNFETAKKTNFKKISNKLSLDNKFNGVVYTDLKVPNWGFRVHINDTVLFSKNYLRFQIRSDESFTRYYVAKTDTILPFAIYPKTAQFYKGRIERVDSYDRINDVFVTLQLFLRKDWDYEAKEIFEYNRFISNHVK